MRITTGTVRNGAIELDGEVLPEGSAVTVLATEGDETFELSPQDEARLVEAMKEAARGSSVSASEVLAQISR